METVRFDELNLDERILRAVTDMGFEAASPIQAQSIPVQAEGLDMIGQAQTGTGNPAAGEDGSGKQKDPGHGLMPHQGAGHPGG